MTAEPTSLSLMTVFEGWAGAQQSLVDAIAPLSPGNLAFRPTPELRSVTEIVRHISGGRVNWFQRMHAPGCAELIEQIGAWDEDPHGNRYVDEDVLGTTAVELVHWLEATWGMVERTLSAWTVPDLLRTYRHTWRGQTYAVSYQWTIWRIMAHDLHHGGELAVMLGMQGIAIPELGDMGGHLTPTPLADDASSG